MPTIDDLPAAVSVTDNDELVVSQSDVARKATRAQLLAGVQAALAVPASSILGRLSPGIGPPETIAIGANFTVADGAISAPAPFIINTLPIGGTPAANDRIPIEQGGQNAALSYASFMSGLATLGGIDASNLNILVAGKTAVRRLADSLSEGVTVESFGAVGDGKTDDTNAFLAALAAETKVRLSGRTYVVNGAITIAGTTSLSGIPGSTTITRLAPASPTSWFTIIGASFQANGITFDAGGLAGADLPAVVVMPSCKSSTFSSCGFTNAVGPASASGLVLSTGLGSYHRLSGCIFSNNGLHGAYVTGPGEVQIVQCVATLNGACGIRIEAEASSRLEGNACDGNLIGISLGTWQSAATESTNPSVAIVLGNVCSGNLTWGVAVGANGGLVTGNSLTNNGSLNQGGGVVARLFGGQVAHNVISGGNAGIDATGSSSSVVAGNHISNAAVGLRVGGSQNLFLSSNFLLSNTWGILVSAIEPSLSLVPTGPITISENWIGFTSAQGGGLHVLDGAQGIAVVGNDFNGWASASVGQALWLDTDAAALRHNRWNNQASFSVQTNYVSGSVSIVVPDVAEDVLVTEADGAVSSILTSHQADTLGQVTFIRVEEGGAGYTHAQIEISGGGDGAAATAYLNQGRVAWIVVTNAGSGYGAVGTQATVSVIGDGSGALATAYVGLPVLEGRKLRVHCNCQLTLAVTGSNPAQQSWTGCNSSIPAFGSLDLYGAFGTWHAEAFPPVDYVWPSGTGGAEIRSVNGGSLTIRPSAGGALYLANSSEPLGCTLTVGRGSPEGSISAPPGSEFRNLDGGIGSTLWIKQVNVDTTGWAAIA